jgi:hypothetical protein
MKVKISFRAVLHAFCVFGEYAERIYAFMEKMQRDTKLRISWLIVVQHFFRSLLSIQDGFDKAKKPFQATVPLTRFLTKISFLHNLSQVRETVSKVSIVTFLNRILTRYYFARKIKKDLIF